MSNNLTQEVLHDIEEHGVTPLPHWRVRAGKITWWVVLMLVSALGVFAAAATAFQIQGAGWPLLWHSNAWFSVFMWSLPYWWLLIITVTAVLAYSAVRHLPRGYRYRVPFVVAGFFLTISLLGWALHTWHFSGSTVDAWGRKVLPFHGAMQAHHQQMWIQPQKGLLAGEVIESSDDSMRIRDFSGAQWQLVASSSLPIFSPQAQVRVLGEPIATPLRDDNVRMFRVRRIEVWKKVRAPMHHEILMKEK
jgi:hypothetical protein